MSDSSSGDQRLTYDQIAIRKCLKEGGGLGDLISNGVDREHLNSSAKDAWDHVTEYMESNGELPGEEVVTIEVGWPKIRYNELPDMTVKHACEHIIKRQLRGEMSRLIDGVERELLKDTDNVYEARDKLLSGIEKIIELDRVDRRAVNIYKLYPQVYQNYLKIESGDTGVDSPYDTFNDSIGGYQFGHATYFIGRPETGKTWVLIYNCMKLRDEGKRVLMVSPELTKLEACERLACIELGISYDRYIKGKLGHPVKSKLKQESEKLKQRDGFYILEDTMNIEKNSVESAIDKYDPDVVAIDSMYKFGIGRNTRERISNSSDWIARVIKRGRPRIGIATHQLNRDAEGSGDITMKEIYGSDAIAQNAHVIYAIEKEGGVNNTSMKELKFKLLKKRRGSDHEPFNTSFDFDKMNFDEISEEERERNNNGDFGSSDYSDNKNESIGY